jgi:hypothetical protein
MPDGFSFLGTSSVRPDDGIGHAPGAVHDQRLRPAPVDLDVDWLFACPFGLHDKTKIIGSFVEALYFSTVVMTTVGFGDIVPATPLGRLVVGGEAILGLFLFALLTSTIYRKLSS